MAKGATRKATPHHTSDRVATLRRAWPFMLMMFLLIAATAVAYTVHARYKNSASWQIKRVRIDGELRQLHSNDVINALALSKGATVLNLELPAMTQRVAALPWVKTVSLRRVYPSELVVQISEREPWLRLNSQQLVDRDQQAFAPHNYSAFMHLPHIVTAEAQLPLALIQYTVANDAMRPLGLAVNQVELNPRRALTLTLNNGVRLMFGRDEWQDRLQRVARLYPGLVQAGAVPTYIDLRYDTGFAVAWPQTQKQSSTATAGL
jgi:cell division protein FtsQ